MVGQLLVGSTYKRLFGCSDAYLIILYKLVVKVMSMFLVFLHRISFTSYPDCLPVYINVLFGLLKKKSESFQFVDYLVQLQDCKFFKKNILFIGI